MGKQTPRWLSTWRGQLQLVGGTYVLALALALGAASQRGFFEGYVREKYKEPSAVSAHLAGRLAQGAVDDAELAALSAPEWAALYYWWMQQPAPGAPAIPLSMFRHAPEVCVDRLERTFVAGTLAQRQRALAFAAGAQSPGLRSSLELGRRAAARSPTPSLAQEFQIVLDSLPP